MDPLQLAAWIALGISGLYLIFAIFTAGRSEPESPDENGAGGMVFDFAGRLPREDMPAMDQMRAYGALCVTTAEQAFHMKLDYTPHSIALLDRAITAGWSERSGEVPEEVIYSFGAYVGEVLVRRTRGRWVTGLERNEPAAVFFLSSDDAESITFSPFKLIREKLANLYGFDLSIAYTALEQKLNELQVGERPAFL